MQMMRLVTLMKPNWFFWITWILVLLWAFFVGASGVLWVIIKVGQFIVKV